MINFEFKQGDVMDTTDWTEEMVQEVLDELNEQGFGGEGLEERHDIFTNLYLKSSISQGGCLLFSCSPFGRYSDQKRNLTWEDITKPSEPEDTDMENTQDTTSPEIPPVIQWECFKEVAKTLGDEDAQWELDKIRNMDDKSELGLDTSEDLTSAFNWNKTPQGDDFWSSISIGIKPEGYDSEPDVPPKPVINKPTTSLEKATEALATELRVSSDELTETFQAKLNEPKLSIGELLEQLYYQTPPVNISFTVQAGNVGEPKVLIHGDGYPVMDATKLTPPEIDKVVESLVILDGCFVEFNGEG